MADGQARDDLRSLRQALGMLRRLISGEVLAAMDIADSSIGRRVVLRRLDVLADVLTPWVRADSRGRGRTKRFRWVWGAGVESSPGDVRALALARTVLHPFHEGAVGMALTSMLEDHLARLPGDHPVRDVLDRMFVPTNMLNPYRVPVAILEQLALAIVNRRLITVAYVQFEGAEQTMLLEPWAVLFGADGPFLYGRIRESSKGAHEETCRMFAVARISEIHIESVPFAYPTEAQYNPAKVWSDCFGSMIPVPGSGGPADVVLDFEPRLHTYLVRQPIHHSQTKPEVLQGDGWVRIRVRVHVLYDLVRWVRGHGASIRVVAPDNLKAWVESQRGGECYREYVIEWGKPDGAPSRRP